MDKEITVEVPEDRVPEFYAWYAHFLASSRRPGRRRRGGHHCRHHHHADQPTADTPATPAPPAA